MAKRNRLLTLEADVGPLVVGYEKDLARFTATAPIDIQTSSLSQLTAAELLGLNAGEVVGEPVLASCGLPFHLIELDSLEALARAQPWAWSEWVSPSRYEQVYLYVIDKTAGQAVIIGSGTLHPGSANP